MWIEKLPVILAIACLGFAQAVFAQTKTDAVRGELLYATHCISCHNSQLHWRDRKVADNWSSLKVEVERWQKTSGLGWQEEDVTDVARYLNALYYRFSEPQPDGASTADATAPASLR